MHTLLFDIDGTLIRTQGAGFSAMAIALDEMFGISEVPSVSVHGRTDRGIIEDIFHQVEIDLEHVDEFSQRYWNHLPRSLEQNDGWVLPGVLELLARLSDLPDVALGILTGNAERAAKIKLEHFELSQFFYFGGYGDHHACRNEVARVASQSAKQYLGERFNERKVWVVGDTVNDIRCARSIQSKVVAVETVVPTLRNCVKQDRMPSSPTWPITNRLSSYCEPC
jgi:phosphoglycolate phosphatase